MVEEEGLEGETATLLPKLSIAVGGLMVAVDHPSVFVCPTDTSPTSLP